MSGLEVIGVVASIIQIADLGAKLSVKLCTFYRTVKAVNQSLQGLSSDVALTCSILNELRMTLEQGDQAKLCSQQAFGTAQDVLQECHAVFQQIETAVEKHNQGTGSNPLRRGARKLTAGFMGPNLELLKCNLERLKTTTLLMLHVIMYAGQLRERKSKSALLDQRDLIQNLLEEKTTNDGQFQKLSHTLLSTGPFAANKSSDETFRGVSSKQQKASLPNELEEYYNLVRTILSDIDACQHSLEQSRHLRIRNGIVNVHSAEVALFIHTHGLEAKKLFEKPIFAFKEGTEAVIQRGNDEIVNGDLAIRGKPEREWFRGRSRSFSSHRSQSYDEDQCDHRTRRARPSRRDRGRSWTRSFSRSRSRSQKNELSFNRRRDVRIVASAPLGTAACAGLYERQFGKRKELDREKLRSRSSSLQYPPSRDSTGLIEYGNDPVAGPIPAGHYYGQPGGISTLESYVRGPYLPPPHTFSYDGDDYSTYSPPRPKHDSGQVMPQIRHRSHTPHGPGPELYGLRARVTEEAGTDEMSRKRDRDDPDSDSDSDDECRNSGPRFDKRSPEARCSDQRLKNHSIKKQRRVRSFSRDKTDSQTLEDGAPDRSNSPSQLIPPPNFDLKGTTSETTVLTEPAIDKALNWGRLEALILQWTNLTREEMEE